MIRILFFGDIVGRPGRNGVKEYLAKFREELKPDLVVANPDNMSSGRGPNRKTYEEMLDSGIDFFTSGDHIWDQKDALDILTERNSRIMRPLNYPAINPGKGFIVTTVKSADVLLVSLVGRVWTAEGADSPFTALDSLLAGRKEKVILVDFHAEATSEKNALAYNFAGSVSAIVGTHTHIQTADERIINDHTAFITDVGFCGPYESVIGVEAEQSIRRFRTGVNVSFDVAKGDVLVCAVAIDIDEKTGKALAINRIREIFSN